jgi:hypothetical protein
MRSSVTALLLAAAVASGCSGPLARMSEVAYRHAVSVGSSRLLAERGYRLSGAPRCTVAGTGNWQSISIVCTAETTHRQQVRITGRVTGGDTGRPAELYAVYVGGRLVATATRLRAAPG